MSSTDTKTTLHSFKHGGPDDQSCGYQYPNGQVCGHPRWEHPRY
jgi:hypothetical protein